MSIALESLARRLDGTLVGEGAADTLIGGAATLETASATDITLLD